uniref:Byssal protein-2 n=1 Tax=Mytilus coruscus TaxID=42192 RepID=A0A0G2YN99_MYTCO|nr:byssal protein-2 [Mytilus coruscus]
MWRLTTTLSIISLLYIAKGCIVCPEGVVHFRCTKTPCQGHQCEGAVCRNNYCGGACRRLWYEDSGSSLMDVTERCEFQCPDSTDCLPGVSIVKCVNPCGLKSCKGYPKAKCCPVYCGGCHALWYVNGAKVTCEK